VTSLSGDNRVTELDPVDQAPFLNIKQMAVLLNVSEVSLRRWTAFALGRFLS
jgi:hypothetical protein